MTKKKTNSSSTRRITHREIGEELGVSKTTISLALSNHPRISEAMKIRVREKADEMGYTPDPMLAALAQYRKSEQQKPSQAVLAWINPLRDPENLRSRKEFALYLDGATKAAERLGYRLEEFFTKNMSLQRMESVFKARNIQGIIICAPLPAAYEDESIKWNDFSWQDFFTVRFGRKVTHPASHFITSAQATNTILSVDKIRERGYQRIGYVGEYTAARIFCAGFLFAQLALPKEQRLPPLFLPEDQSCFSENKQKLKQWIDTYQPDAILTDATLLHDMLQELGHRVPEDIGLATTSVHDTPIDAGINQNPSEIGTAAVRMLVALLNEHNVGIPSIRNEVLIEGHWEDGSMLPPRD